MTQIEEYLRKHGGWVPAAELARLFNIPKRDLRTRDDTPGICSDFAISGNAGLKHIGNATEEEWTHFHGRIRSHSIAQLRRLKRLRHRRQARREQMDRRVHYESATGQGLLI